MLKALDKPITLQDQIDTVTKIRSYRVFEDDRHVINSVLDTLHALRLQEEANKAALRNIKDPLHPTFPFLASQSKSL